MSKGEHKSNREAKKPKKDKSKKVAAETTSPFSAVPGKPAKSPKK